MVGEGWGLKRPAGGAVRGENRVRKSLSVKEGKDQRW